MRISDWSSDVCSSDLGKEAHKVDRLEHRFMFQDIEKWPIGHFAFNAHFLSEHEGKAKTMKPYPLPRDGDHGFAAQWQSCSCEQHIKPASAIEDYDKGNRQIGRATVCTPITNAHLVCCLMFEQKKRTLTERHPQ